jgi:hypothetical protein
LSAIDEHCVSSYAAHFARSHDGALTGQLRAFQGNREAVPRIWNQPERNDNILLKLVNAQAIFVWGFGCMARL